MQHEQNPYDFILNSGQAAKAPRGGSNSMVGRILIVLVGLIVLLFVGLGAASILTDDGGLRESLLKVTQTQGEAARVAKLVAKDASSQKIKNIALSTQLSVTTHQSKLQQILTDQGIKFERSELALGTDPKVEDSLKIAKSGGLFDPTALQILESKLKDYQAALSASFQIAQNQELKSQLSEEFDATKLLLNEIRLLREE